MPIRHFELIRGWQGTAKLSVRMWINGNLTPVNCCYSYCFLSGNKELNPFFLLSIIVHLLNFEFVYLCNFCICEKILIQIRIRWGGKYFILFHREMDNLIENIFYEMKSVVSSGVYYYNCLCIEYSPSCATPFSYPEGTHIRKEPKIVSSWTNV